MIFFVLTLFFFFLCEQWKEYKITEKNNKAGLNRKGDRRKCKEKQKDGKQWKGIKMDGQILLNGKRAGFGRIFGMEIGDNVGSMSKFIGR